MSDFREKGKGPELGLGAQAATPAGSTRVRRRKSGWRSADVIRATILVIVTYLAFRLVWFANLLFLVAFLGILFGLAVSSGVDRLARWRVPRGAGAAIVVITFFALLAGFGAWLAPTIRSQSIELRHRLPDAADRLETWMSGHRSGLLGMVLSGVTSGPSATDTTKGQQPAASDTTAPSIPASVQNPDSASHPSRPMVNSLRERIGNQFSGIGRYLFPFLSSTMEVVTGILIIVFLSVYIAVDPDLYRRGIMQLFPRKRRARVGEVLSAMAAVLRKWLVTQLIAMVVIGTITTILLIVLRVKAAVALGMLAGLLEFIPTVGPIVSALPAIAMGFVDSPEKALWVAIGFVGVQFVENHLLIPLLMKGGVNLPPALTVFSQALMALLFGFLGLMCAVPLLAASVVAVKMLYVEDVMGIPQLGPGEDPAKGTE